MKNKPTPKEPLTIRGFFDLVVKYAAYLFVGVSFVYAAGSAFFISSSDIEDEKYARQQFSDGEYSAEVTYVNTCSGRRGYYTPTVDISGDSLKRINFENGGYVSASKLDVGKAKNGVFKAKAKSGCEEYTIEVVHLETPAHKSQTNRK